MTFRMEAGLYQVIPTFNEQKLTYNFNVNNFSSTVIYFPPFRKLENQNRDCSLKNAVLRHRLNYERVDGNQRELDLEIRLCTDRR